MIYDSEVIGCSPITYNDFSVLRDSNFQIVFDNVNLDNLFLVI